MSKYDTSYLRSLQRTGGEMANILTFCLAFFFGMLYFTVLIITSPVWLGPYWLFKWWRARRDTQQ